MPLTSIDHYLLHEELGHGGMATVYRATDQQLEREVALKILHDHIAAQPENRERFLREARAAARLSHPNILKIYGFSAPEDSLGYLAMERINGPTLRSLDTRDLREFPEIAVSLVYIIAQALEHALENGILHRDIKPENIMVDHHGRPRLMDFGLARLLDAHTMTATGSLLGSPAHMAPEIVEGKPYDTRVDIFALGTVLYFIATGQLPYEASNPATLLHKILNGDYESARDINPAINRELNRIIDQMLERDPEERIASPTALLATLRSWLTPLGIEDPESVFRRWYVERDAFLDELRPRLESAWMARAESAYAQGRSAIPQTLDLANRVLLLNPENVRGHELLDAVAHDQSHAKRMRRLAAVVAAVLALGLGFVVLVQLSPDPPPLHTIQTVKLPPADVVIVAPPEAEETPPVETPAPEPIPLAARQAAANHIGAAHRQARSAAATQARAIARRERERERSAADAANAANATTPPPQEPANAAERVDVTIYVQPPAAEIFVDGERRCSGSPRCDLRLSVGTHEIVARHPGTGVEVRERLSARQNGTELRIRVPWRPGILIVEANRPGIVLFNGKRVGRTGTSIEIPIDGMRSTIDGSLRVIPDGDFGVPVERRINIASGETRREDVSF